MKAGRAIPVKFSLGGDQGLAIFAAGYPVSQQVDCVSGAPLVPVEEAVTAGHSSLQYDPSTDQYTYVWKTDKTWQNTCRTLDVKLSDATDHLANFKFS
ncbi:MAG: PxKF domain-containing protein [Microlunatus sp.]|nr:PxKF domain-containing protein [Microlunatus sp.]